jgi:DNA-binding transcriptional MocR family regulator
MRDLSLVPLGSAYLGADSLPIAALNKLAAGIAREMSTTGATYDPARGLTALRRQLARRSVSWGLSLHEDDFVTTIGATEALYLGLRAVARPGDAVAVESPTYFGVLQVIEALGMGAVEVPADPTTGLDLDALEDVLRGGRVRAVVAQTTATNPLGAVMPDEARRRLVRMIDRHDLPLIEDDVYGDLVFRSSGSSSPTPWPARPSRRPRWPNSWPAAATTVTCAASAACSPRGSSRCATPSPPPSRPAAG